MKSLTSSVFVSTILLITFLNCERNITHPGTDYANFTIKQLTSSVENDIYPSWSRDSQRIVFNRNGSICVLTVQTNEIKTFNVEMSGGSTPTFSPDGKSIFYEKKGALCRLNLANGNQEIISTGYFPIFWPCSSSEPDIICFTHKDKIIKYDISQGSSIEFQGAYRHQLLPRVTFGSNKTGFISYSYARNKTALSVFKDEHQILSLEFDDPFYDEFVQYISERNIVTSVKAERGRKVVALNAANGAIVQPFTNGEYFDKHVALSPNNKMIAFSRDVSTLSDSTLFVAYDAPPQPVGGFASLQKNLIYPDSALANGIEGRVYVNARVFIDGVVDSTFISQSLGYGCDQAAIRAVKLCTWMPAYRRNNPVPVWVVLPIVFRMNRLYKSNSSIKIDAQNIRYSASERQANLYLIELH